MKTLQEHGNLKNILWSFVVIGVACFGVLFVKDKSQAWHAYIMNSYFVLSIALGGMFFVGIQHLASAGWSATVRRIPEAFIGYVPLAILSIIPIAAFGMHYVYEWTHADVVAKDHLLQIKSAYLNVPFFGVRTLIFFAVWFFLGGKIVSNSIKQDDEGGTALTEQSVKLSAIFMPLFALSFTFLSVDLIMSLDPHWFSTMFGVNCFANLFLSALAVIIIIIVNMKRAGYFGNSVNENHIQNLGLFMFAFTVFYAYIAFSQFMLIWYSNLPEETSYYLRRMENGWWVVALMIVAFKFVIPFLLLLPREAKRNMNFLIKMAYLILIACWLDVFWMVMPAYSDKPYFPALEIGMALGFAGAFGLAVTKRLQQHPIMPQKDPRVHEALALHQ